MTIRGEEDDGEGLYRQSAITVRLLLALDDLPQGRLAREIGCGTATISQLQRGRREPGPGMLERLASARGWPLSLVEEMARRVVRVRRARRSGGAPEIVLDAVEIARRVAERVEAALPEIEALLAAGAERDPSPTAEGREAAEDLWGRLADLPLAEQRFLIDLSPAFWTPAVARRIARASVDAAERPGEALDL